MQEAYHTPSTTPTLDQELPDIITHMLGNVQYNAPSHYTVSWQAKLVTIWLYRRLQDGGSAVITDDDLCLFVCIFSMARELYLPFDEACDALDELEAAKHITTESDGDATAVIFFDAVVRQYNHNVHLPTAMKTELSAYSAMKARMISDADHTCTYCKRTGDAARDPDGHRWHLDHVIPRSRGGKSKNNLVVACAHCNHRKSDKPVEDFLRSLVAV
jgi:hypothetical protein